MANNTDRYQRRCADLGVDGEYRVGKLIFVCKLTSNRKSAVCGALMLCDCGLFCKLTMPMLNGLREYGEPLPWECQTCQKRRKAMLRDHRSRRLAKAAKEARRLPPAPHVSLRSLYPSEYMAWKGAKFNRKEPMCRKWSHSRAGFKNFLRDMGSKPTDKARLARRDNNHMHNRLNTYWRIPPPPKWKPKPVSTEEKFVLKFKPYVLPPPPIKKNLPVSGGNVLEPLDSEGYPSLSGQLATPSGGQGDDHDHQHSNDSGHPGGAEGHPTQGYPQSDPQTASGQAAGSGLRDHSINESGYFNRVEESQGREATEGQGI